jgi:glyoxylase-like metal-dependent hydrolase (beta-lactamase superfamily II)
MKQIVPNIFLVDASSFTNVYLLVSPAGLVLVDTGMAGDARKITEQLIHSGFDLNNLRGIVLTHAHFDHVGSAAEIKRLSRAPILAHKDEVAYVEQTRLMPVSSFTMRLLSWFENHLLFRSNPCKVDEAVEDGALIEATGGFRTIHTPGHTPGSLCLYHPEQQVLICGDAFFNRNPMTGKKGLTLPIPFVSWDTARARESARKLSQLKIETLLCGHGEPIVGGADSLIANLVG